jgi:hypothetical protein
LQHCSFFVFFGVVVAERFIDGVEMLAMARDGLGVGALRALQFSDAIPQIFVLGGGPDEEAGINGTGHAATFLRSIQASNSCQHSEPMPRLIEISSLISRWQMAQ